MLLFVVLCVMWCNVEVAGIFDGSGRGRKKERPVWIRTTGVRRGKIVGSFELRSKFWPTFSTRVSTEVRPKFRAKVDQMSRWSGGVIEVDG
jgi:hypothetical protein